MLGLLHLAPKSCFAGKLFLAFLSSDFFNLKLVWSLQKLQRLLFFKPYSLFSLTCPWKLKCRKSLFVKCTYCMVVSRLIPFEFLLWSRITGRFSFSSKIPEFSVRNQMERTISVRFGPTGIFVTTFEGGPLRPVCRSFRSVCRTKLSLSIWQNCCPRSTALLYPAYKNDNQTRGGLGRVRATGMCRSIGHVELSKFQTGIFAEGKAPTFSQSCRYLSIVERMSLKNSTIANESFGFFAGFLL